VFYRASTEARARELGLTGWVCNRSDGRVELLACGPADRLALLEAWLWEGPAHARVTEVVATATALQDFKDFHVR